MAEAVEGQQDSIIRTLLELLGFPEPEKPFRLTPENELIREVVKCRRGVDSDDQFSQTMVGVLKMLTRLETLKQQQDELANFAELWEWAYGEEESPS